MDVLYDTRPVHPLDRYEYARAGAAGEMAPVSIRGRAPGELLAVMSIARIGEFTVEAVAWAADSPIVAHRTERLIRACDPECYRLYLSVNGGGRMEQAGHRVSFGARDLALYDLSRPWQTAHSVGRQDMRLVMLTFPRAFVPLARSAIAPAIGTIMPRGLAGRRPMARLLMEFSDGGSMLEHAEESGLADILRECVGALIRQRLGLPGGISRDTHRRLHLLHLHSIIGRHLGDPALDPAAIARSADISPRYLHKLFQDNDLTPMQLLKQLRLIQCHRRLRDPAWESTPIRQIGVDHGYLRPDRFARDFKQLFGMSPMEVRRLARRPGPGHEG